jgi:hypothetical protein
MVLELEMRQGFEFAGLSPLCLPTDDGAFADQRGIRLFTTTLPLFFIDLILGFTLLEAVFLVWRYRASGLGLSDKDICMGLLPGFCLMLGLRFAAQAEVPLSVFACLLAAGVAHALDFYRRYRLAAETPHQN